MAGTQNTPLHRPINGAETAADDAPLTVIEPRRGWQPVPWRELWRYRELIYFLAWRDIKVRYKQTLLGALWAVLQPTLMMVVFTLVFSRMAADSSPGVAYPLFVYTGLVGWTLFAASATGAAQSVVSAERLVTKIYFPRLALPLAAIGASLVDFVLASGVLFALLIYYGQGLSATAWLLPLAALLLVLAAAGFGSALAALNVAYRDIRYVLPFLMQLWLLATPSVYLAEAPAGGGDWLGLNPLDGLVRFFRSTVLGQPFDWQHLAYPAAAVTLAFFGGCYYFRHVEDSFADVL